MSCHVCVPRIAATAGLAALVLAAPAPAYDEAPRFDAVARTVARAGFAQPRVVGHGAAAADELFALLATRDGKGVLVIASDAAPPAPPAPVEIDDTPAQMGVRGVQFSAFLNTPGLFDVVVTHEPFMLETSFRSETHHILRRLDTTLALVCTFPGSSSSSTSKGIGSLSHTRRVTIESGTSRVGIGFIVNAVEETTQTEGLQGRSTSVSRTDTRTTYELPPSGMCKEP